MSWYQNTSVKRDGFTSEYGRFCANGRVERIDGARLKEMFLPRLTPEANRLLRDHHDFVRGQLKHYGVEYDESEYSGNGMLLLKKALKEGKLDKVPEHIERLRAEIHHEWLWKRSDKDLSNTPGWTTQKYFLDLSGQPDHSKTTSVIALELEQERGSWRYHERKAEELCRAVGQVPGLHHAIVGSFEKTVYLGWDRRAVEKAARQDGDRIAKRREAEKKERIAKRDALHADFMKKEKEGNGKPYGLLTGRYLIDVKGFYGSGMMEEDPRMLIERTAVEGIYKAEFDLGNCEGVILLSQDEEALEEFCQKTDRDEAYYDDEDDEDEDDGDDEKEEEEPPTTSRKRKAAGSNPASKKDKFFLRIRYRELHGPVNYDATKGVLELKTKAGVSYATFVAHCDLGPFGDVDIAGRKFARAPLRPHMEGKR